MWKPRLFGPLFLLGALASVWGAPVAACTSDAECDNGDTCSVPDQCQGGSCVLGGGGDTDGNLICDAEFDPDVALRNSKLAIRTFSVSGTTIRGTGDFIDLTPPGPFSTSQGVSIRVKDQLSSVPPTGDGVDVTVSFGAADCTPMGDVVKCVLSSGPLHGSQARFNRNQFVPEQMKLSYRLRRLPLTKPFFGPMTVILTDNTTIHRLGRMIDCRLFPTGMRCREF